MHAAGFQLGLIMRALLSAGTPNEFVARGRLLHGSLTSMPTSSCLSSCNHTIRFNSQETEPYQRSAKPISPPANLEPNLH